MDGYHPNAFLAKKLMTEGLLDDDEESEILKNPIVPKEKEINKNEFEPMKHQIKPIENNEDIEMTPAEDVAKDEETEITEKKLTKTTDKKLLKQPDITEKVTNVKENVKSKEIDPPISTTVSLKKRLSDTSEDSDTQVIIMKGNENVEKRKSTEVSSVTDADTPIIKKRKGSPIVFDVDKKEKGVVRERTISASSDSNVTLNTNTNSHKYDSVPPCKFD